jgi:hypothetical protein
MEYQQARNDLACPATCHPRVQLVSIVERNVTQSTVGYVREWMLVKPRLGIA